MKIAVVGAPRTGKTTLVRALQLAPPPVGTHPTPGTVVEGLALVDAVWQDLMLQDPSSYAAALEQHRNYDLTLLTGLDLPIASNREYQPTAAQCDARLRQVLDSHAIAYAVVYGTGPSRTDSALQAIAYHRQNASSKGTRRSASAWQWCCETCSDADCEHRLFTALVNERRSVRP